MKITMSQPKIILNIIKVIHEKLEIVSEKDELISVAIWDFSDDGKISKTDIRNGLKKLAEDEKLFDLEDDVSLYLQGWIPGEEIKIRVNRKRFGEFYKKHKPDILKLYKKDIQTRVSGNKNKEGVLITRNEKSGDFYFKNKPIKFQNKEAIYYLIFECLCEKGELDGFCSYETINKYLEKHNKEELTDEQQIKNRIKNGIENLFRFSNLPRKAPDGKELIRKVRGKAVILHNPPI